MRSVIGGGNTAMDSVRTARRLGAERAMIIYRRSEEEMPARIEEVKHAKEEGVEFLTLHNPIEYIADEQGKVKQVVLQKMELGEPDASGRRSPVPIPGATETIDIDLAIVSVGVLSNRLSQAPSRDWNWAGRERLPSMITCSRPSRPSLPEATLSAEVPP